MRSRGDYDGSGRSFDGLVPKDSQAPSRLMKPTMSIVCKRQPKKVLQPLPAFRAGGSTRTGCPRTGGPVIGNRRLEQGSFFAEEGGDWKSVDLSKREEKEASSRLILSGPFVPTSSRPIWEVLAPLSYRRLPMTVQVKVRPQRNMRRTANQTAPLIGFGSPGRNSLPAAWGDSQPPTADPSSRATAKRGTGLGTTLAQDPPPSSAPAVLGPVEQHGLGVDSVGPSDKKRGSVKTLDEEQRSASKGKDEIKSEFGLVKEDKPDIETFESKVFRRFQEDSTVHIDDLPKVLAALGFAQPQQDWIPHLLEPITSFRQLTFDKFVLFAEAYKLKQKLQHRYDFDAIDDDGSGTLDKDELVGLIHSWGMFPMPHVLEEILDEVDEDGSGHLDFEEFENVVFLLQTRQGFSKPEFNEITGIFRAFDRNKEGLMDTSDVGVALDWLGYAMTDEQMEAIEVDIDGSGLIDELEWVTGMRKVREAKVTELQDIIEQNDTDGDGNIQFNELIPILCSMGYFPDDQAVREAAITAGIAEDDKDLDFRELWNLLKVYRDREGLTSQEVEEIEAGFVQAGAGADLEGEVTAVQIGKIVRSIGYMLSFDVQQSLISKVDLNKSGALDQREFRKMIRLIKQQDIDIVCLAFQQAGGMQFGNSMMPANQLPEDPSQYRSLVPGDITTISASSAKWALRRVNCVDCSGTVAEILVVDKVGVDQIDIYGFCAIAKRSREASRSAFRKNGGFCKEEVEEMEISFRRYDSDASGELTGLEIVKVLEQNFPTLANDPTRRPLIQQLLKEADQDGNGSLDFGDFLRLMRQVKDIQDQLMVAKEMKAIEDTQFSPSEVLEFRELMLAVRGVSMEIGFEEVQMLLGAIVPMGAKNIKELRVKYDDVAARQSGVEGSAELLDFPEFLWLMRELLDMNFANMAQRVEEMTPQKSIA